MNLDLVIFAVSSVVAIFSAIMVFAQRNPIASVLYLILSLLSQAVLYVQLGALFMGAILIIVYAGAIMVLFLFVIMLLNLRGTEDLGLPSHPLSTPTKIIISTLFAVQIVLVAGRAALPPVTAGMLVEPDPTFGSVTEVGRLMFTEWVYPLQLTGILLLIAVVAAVVLAQKERSEDEPVVTIDQAGGPADPPTEKVG